MINAATIAATIERMRDRCLPGKEHVVTAEACRLELRCRRVRAALDRGFNYIQFFNVATEVRNERICSNFERPTLRGNPDCGGRHGGFSFCDSTMLRMRDYSRRSRPDCRRGASYPSNRIRGLLGREALAPQ